jgi:hypothetical protein
MFVLPASYFMNFTETIATLSTTNANAVSSKRNRMPFSQKFNLKCAIIVDRLQIKGYFQSFVAGILSSYWHNNGSLSCNSNQFFIERHRCQTGE